MNDNSATRDAKILAFIRAADELHSAPGVAQSLLNLTKQPDFDVREVVDCLERDPALSARLLRVVNSAHYGLRQPIRNLRQGVLPWGQRPLRLITMTFSVLELFSRGPAQSLYTDYWRQAMTMATTAMRLAKRSNEINPDDAYTAGLLAHLGTLLLTQVHPEEYIPLFASAKSGAELVEAERKTFGLDHSELGAVLLAEWGFPLEFVDGIAQHHADDTSDALANLIHAGDLLADLLWKPGTSSMAIANCWLAENHGLGIDDLIDLAQTCSEEVALEAEIYGIHLGNPINSQELLDAARSQYLDVSLETAWDLDSLTAVLQEPDPLS